MQMMIHDLDATRGPDYKLFKPKKPMATLMAGDEYIAFWPGSRFAKTRRRGEYRSSLGRVSFAVQFGRKEQLYPVGHNRQLTYSVWSLVIVLGDTKHRFHFRKLKA